MTEKEMVVKGLECHLDEKVICDSCPYSVECGCFSLLLNDALKVLKEQEAEQPIVHENSYGWKFYYCPKCKQEFYQNRKQAYCDKCGKAVKWE